FCIAPSNPHRLYAVVSSKKLGGIYRSDDGGESWNMMSSDIRYWYRGDDFAEIKADPKNADIVYDVNVVSWKSVDGGKTWTGWKGAPGGDDYHRLWINPENTDVMLLAGDQGAAVTVNGGRTWSSWYNQPTAQFYHVSTDNAFPYNVLGAQQESGSAGVASRSNDGEITFRDWHPVAAEEWGYVVADPLNPNIVFGGKISKFDKRTGQVQDIAPDCHSGKYRFIRTAPIAFSPVDNKTLYFAGNVIFKSTDYGNSWDTISPDLTRKSYEIPKSVGVYYNDTMKYMRPRGVVYTLALSPLDENLIWAGSDDGLIHVTHNGGGSWDNVTPPTITDWNKISMLEASHSDKNTAYAAVNCIRVNDEHPHIYRTMDGGKTWKEIVNGLPEAPINSVKEDPIRKGLLFAGSERAVYVSFDDGEHWQSLRLNMPASSIRDLTIKDNDLVVATHGRSFWILDDITSLRQIDKNISKEKTTLYQPEPAYRVRWDMWPDTPLPADEPAGKNPPDGAIIDYYISPQNPKGASNGSSQIPIRGLGQTDTVSLTIYDSLGNLIRRYTSKDSINKIPDVNIPLYWVRPQQILSADSGSHRFLWDMHYTPLNVPPNYPISAITGETPPAASSPWVMPGTYTVKLTVTGKVYSQQLIIKMDPRVKASTFALTEQHDYSMVCYNDEQIILPILQNINSLQAQIKALPENFGPGNHDSLINGIDTCYFKLGMLRHLLTDGIPEGRASVNDQLQQSFGAIEGTDAQPTTQCIGQVNAANARFEKLLEYWETLQKDLKRLNALLKANSLTEVKWK
ncbi:MAG TPA: glycoside hydrolase, partial [Bacteroidia bacterium]|nr:glycoside hydrolase [Bacteroidia bacterium]